MLRGDHGEFWLEPVALSPEEERVRLEEERLEDAGAEGRGAAGLYRNSVLGRPHLVFRRSVEQPQLEIGAAGRARRRRKKKKKLERNCGTRGENPPTPFSPLPALPGLLSSPTFFSLLAFPPLFVFPPLSPPSPPRFFSSLGFCARLPVRSLLSFYLPFGRGGEMDGEATISGYVRLSDSFFPRSTRNKLVSRVV